MSSESVTPAPSDPTAFGAPGRDAPGARDLANPVARRTVARAAAWLGLASLALGALLLASPAARDARAPRAVLVDRSASVTGGRPDWAAAASELVRSEARAGEAAGQEILVVAFDASVERIFGPGPARELLEHERSSETRHSRAAGAATVTGAGIVRDLAPDERDPARAAETRLAEALELVRRTGAREVVLFSDRTYTGLDPRAALDALVADGARVRWIEPPRRARHDWSFGRLAAARDVEVGAPLSIAFDVHYLPGDEAAGSRRVATHLCLSNAVGHAGEDLVLAIPRELVLDDDGSARVTFVRDVGHAAAGVNVISVGGCPAEDGVDVARSAKSARATVIGAGVATIGIVRGTPALPGWARSIDPARGVQPVALVPADVGLRLARLDALVVDGVALDALPVELVLSFVEQGGGLLALGGGALLDDAGAARALAERLPLRPPSDELPPRDVVFLIDGSGSMVGPPFDAVREALRRIVGSVGARDAVELRLFAERLGEPIELVARGAGRAATQAARARLATLSAPGGPTGLVAALEELVAVRVAAGREALVVLLSDGRDTTADDRLARADRARASLGAARARLVVIAANAEADRALLGALAGSAADVVELTTSLATGSADELAAIFAREANRERMREGASLAVRAAPLPPGTAGQASLAAELVRATPELPSIERYVRAELAPGAEAVWVAESGEPLLAIARVGLGLVAASAFAPDADIARAWVERGDLLAPILRVLARRADEPRARIEIEGAELVARDLPQGTPPIVVARIVVAAAGPDTTAREPIATIVLTPPLDDRPASTRAGAWNAALASDVERGLGASTALQVELAPLEGSTWNGLDLALALPPRPEFVFPRPRVAVEHDARAVVSTDADARTRSAHPAAPAFLLAGLLALSLSAWLGHFSRSH